MFRKNGSEYWRLLVWEVGKMQTAKSLFLSTAVGSLWILWSISCLVDRQTQKTARLEWADTGVVRKWSWWEVWKTQDVWLGKKKEIPEWGRGRTEKSWVPVYAAFFFLQHIGLEFGGGLFWFLLFRQDLTLQPRLALNSQLSSSLSAPRRGFQAGITLHAALEFF